MVNADTSKAMQEALQAAVSRMNSGSAESRSSPVDFIGPLMPMVAKLLQNSGSGEEMLERLDTLQKGELATLRQDVQILRKQCYRMLKAQEELLAKVHEIQRQQIAAAGAVLDLAQQMARITFVDGPSDDEDEDDDQREAPPAPAGKSRFDARTSRNGNGKRQRNT